MNEEKINDAQIEEVTEKIEESQPKKRKMDFYIEAILIVVLGFLVGVAVKTEASKKITIGFDDYKMKVYKNDYNLNELQIIQANKQAEAASQEQASGSVDESSQGGGSCGGAQ